MVLASMCESRPSAVPPCQPSMSRPRAQIYRLGRPNQSQTEIESMPS